MQTMSSRKRQCAPRIVPVILAAGRAPALAKPQALAQFGKRTALEIAITNCRDARNAGGQSMLKAPIVVLGWRAGEVRRALHRLEAAQRRGVRVIINRHWRTGQMSSLRAALRRIPRGSAVLLYPVDYALVTPQILTALARAFAAGASRTQRSLPCSDCIIVPSHRGRTGHPVLFAAAPRQELLAAGTARDVVESHPARVKRVPVGSPAIWQDYDTPEELRRCQRKYKASHRTRERGMNREHP